MNPVRVIGLNLAFSALVIFIAALALRVDRFWPFALPVQLSILAWPLLILGILLLLAAEFAFLSRSGATGVPGNPPGKLVTEGIYAWVRNPIYIGALLVLFGVTFSNRSPTLLLLTLAFLPLIHWYVVHVEEPRTERRFGDEYVRYRQSVPRWIPRLWKKK